MRKLLTLIALLAFFVMSFTPAIVAAPPTGDGSFSINGTDSDGGEDPPPDPPIDPPDGDPWSPSGKMIFTDNDSPDTDLVFLVKVRILCVKVIVGTF